MANLAAPVFGATTPPFYSAYAPEVDRHGVIAPWYKGQNGQFDYRVRIAAEFGMEVVRADRMTGNTR